MRIAVWHNLPSGGGKRVLFDQVRGLAERGHYIESWCPPTADQTYLPLSDLIQEHIVPLRRDVPQGRGRIAAHLRPYRTMEYQLEAMDEHCRECAEEINRGDFDVLLAHPCQYYRTTSIGRHVDTRKVYYLQEPYRWLYEALPTLPWLALDMPPKFWRNRQLLKTFIGNAINVQSLRLQAREELRAAKAFDLILVNSYFSRESVLRAYGLESEVCYPGVDVDFFNPRSLPKEHAVVGIGAFVPEKSIDFVIKAVSRTREPKPRLTWIGNVASDSYMQQLKNLAAEVNVDFDPHVRASDEELLNLLGSAKVLVHAPRLEPFGLAPLEGNACGLPVVATAEGGSRETILDGVNGLLVDRDTSCFADGIDRLLADEEYAASLGQRGREIVVQKWSYVSSIDRLEEKLKKAVSA